MASLLDVRTAVKTSTGACAVGMLTLIGAAVAARALARLAAGLWVYFLRPGKDLKKLGERVWAGGGGQPASCR